MYVYEGEDRGSNPLCPLIFVIFSFVIDIGGYHHAHRTKGSKNKPKAINDYASQITEKQETIASLNAEIVFIQKAIEEQKNTLKEKKIALKKAEKEVASMEAKKAKADAKVAEEVKKVEAESVVKKLLASGMSADEILEKLK